MSISGVGASTSINPIEWPTQTGTAGTTGTESSGDFGDRLTGAIDNLQQVQNKSDDLAMQVATGDLTDIHDYMIAANQAEIATQLTVAVRNRAVEAFNQIMNMQV